MAGTQILPQIVSNLGESAMVRSLPTTRASTSAQPPSLAAEAGPVARPPARDALPTYFEVLLAWFGAQHWWPGRTRFEVIVGAILTQNTSWTNVEPAIRNLRKARLLSPAAILKAPRARIETAIRPSGYFRQKTKTLKGFVHLLFEFYGGSLSRFFAVPTSDLRQQLLALRGIGPETADSILLYAGQRPLFVADAYARRMLERHSLCRPKSGYEEIRIEVERDFPADPAKLNEFHALIVQTGKHFCRAKKPRCSECPLGRFLPQSTLTAP
jgi:endonuclease-3 related protein